MSHFLKQALEITRTSGINTENGNLLHHGNGNLLETYWKWKLTETGNAWKLTMKMETYENGNFLKLTAWKLTYKMYAYK